MGRWQQGYSRRQTHLGTLADHFAPRGHFRQPLAFLHHARVSAARAADTQRFRRLLQNKTKRSGAEWSGVAREQQDGGGIAREKRTARTRRKTDVRRNTRIFSNPLGQHHAHARGSNTAARTLTRSARTCRRAVAARSIITSSSLCSSAAVAVSARTTCRRRRCRCRPPAAPAVPAATVTEKSAAECPSPSRERRCLHPSAA